MYMNESQKQEQKGDEEKEENELYYNNWVLSFYISGEGYIVL